MEWPPSLEDLKLDLKIEDDRDDERLQQMLDAAVAYVERVRSDVDYSAPVPADLVVGALRLAGRWNSRRRSPDALVDAGDLGSSRIPGVDPDIERLLGIGRFRGAMFA